MSELILSFEKYLLTEKYVASNTFHAYKRDMYQLVGYLQEQNIRIEHATHIDIKRFLATLKKHGTTARSLARKISTLKTFYKYASEQHHIPNLGAELVTPKIEKKLPRCLSEDEIKMLFTVAEYDKTFLGFRNKMILYLLYVSGMRITELAGLVHADIYFESGYLLIKGKAGKSRMVPLPDSALALLKEYLQALQQMLLRKKIDSPYLFPVLYKERIRPITRQACWVIMQKLWKKTGIPYTISPHTLRHSLATHLLKNGMDLRALQILLGHEHVTTVQIYTHVETSRLREIYNKKHPRS